MKIILFLNRYRKKIWASWQIIIVLFTQRIVTKLSKIKVGDPGSGKKPIPDPGIKKAPDPRSGYATLPTSIPGYAFFRIFDDNFIKTNKS